MEMRRRSSTRHTPRRSYTSSTYSRRRSSDEGGGFFSLLILVVMAAGAVYVLVATPIGARLASAIIGIGSQPSPAPSIAPLLPSAEPTAAPDTGKAESASLSLPALDMYALQLGLYDSAANAQGLVSTIRSLGAAGYSFSTDAGTRILASCYTTEAAASSVSKRLNEQGYECIVFPISRNGVELNVTASSERLDSIRSAAALAHGIIDSLNEEVIRFDREERSVEYGHAVANEMLGSVRAAREALSGLGDAGGTLRKLDEYFTELTGCFTRFISADTDNRVELSGRLKHLQLEVIDRYARLLDSLGTQHS